MRFARFTFEDPDTKDISKIPYIVFDRDEEQTLVLDDDVYVTRMHDIIDIIRNDGDVPLLRLMWLGANFVSIRNLYKSGLKPLVEKCTPEDWEALVQLSWSGFT